MTKKRTHEEYENLILQKELTCYPLESYVTNHVKILHRCVNCENEWYIKPAHVLAGHGCRKCSDNTKRVYHTEIIDTNPEKTKVYYVSIRRKKDNVTYYKIGITKRLETRFSAETDKEVTFIKIWNFNSRREALKFEQLILREFKPFRNKRKFLKAGGNTELFPFDILNLNKG
jgi:hypothetical protein